MFSRYCSGLLLLACASAALPTTLEARAVSGSKIIFSFGDSYTDTAFKPSLTLPSPSCPMGNPGCNVGGSYTGGYNWISALTSLSNQTLVQTFNHAHSGDVLDSTLPTLTGRSGIIQKQYPAFQSYQDRICWKNKVDDVLFSVFIGINDVDLVWRTVNETWWSEEFKSYEYLLDTFYDLGGRHFLLQSVPPIERSPKFLYSNEETRHGVAEAVLRFNKELRNLEVRFKCKHKDVTVTFWDGHDVYDNILDDPQSFGFDDATSMCRGGNCFWNDNFHPSEKAQKLFAQDIGEALAADGFWGVEKIPKDIPVQKPGDQAVLELD